MYCRLCSCHANRLFYTVRGSKEETVIYCGDRWANFAGNGLGYNQWCPLSFNGDTPYFNSLSSWHLNIETGEWRVADDNNYVKMVVLRLIESISQVLVNLFKSNCWVGLLL